MNYRVALCAALALVSSVLAWYRYASFWRLPGETCYVVDRPWGPASRLCSPRVWRWNQDQWTLTPSDNTTSCVNRRADLSVLPHLPMYVSVLWSLLTAKQARVYVPLHWETAFIVAWSLSVVLHGMSQHHDPVSHALDRLAPPFPVDRCPYWQSDEMYFLMILAPLVCGLSSLVHYSPDHRQIGCLRVCATFLWAFFAVYCIGALKWLRPSYSLLSGFWEWDVVLLIFLGFNTHWRNDTHETHE